MENRLQALIETLERSRPLLGMLESAAAATARALTEGHKLLTCGNGGSAADALHLAEELVGRYSRERRSLAAICLNSDATAITCIVNDYGWASCFSRQIESLGQPGDVWAGFTTSGNSENVYRAVNTAAEKGLTTLLFSGRDGGKCRGIADHELIVPSEETARIQEVHTLLLHCYIEKIEDILFEPEQQ